MMDRPITVGETCVPLSVQRLHELLRYDPATGLFTWLVATTIRIRVGDVAGCLRDDNCRLIGIDSSIYRAHRLAWLYMTGEWPAREIDHINLNRDDNRWCNLREATRMQNQANTRALATNSSGLKGVSWDAHRRKWRAQIQVLRKNIYLGRFAVRGEAHSAYAIAARKYFGEFARIE